MYRYITLKVPLVVNLFFHSRSIIFPTLQQIIQGAGHHVYADKREKFNELVLKAAANGDENDVIRFSGKPIESETAKSQEDKDIELEVHSERARSGSIPKSP